VITKLIVLEIKKSVFQKYSQLVFGWLVGLEVGGLVGWLVFWYVL